MTTRRRPYGELVREAEKARLLLDAARQLGETLEPERVYERFRALLGDVVEHDGVIVSSYEDADGLIRCDYAWSDGERLDASRLPPLPLNREGGGMQSRVIVSGEPLLVNDVPEVVQHEPGIYYDVDREGTMRKVPEAGAPKTRAALMVPVKHEGAVVGVVQVMSDRAEYGAEQLELVEGLVGQMAAAVRNARLQKERIRLEAAEAAARAAADEQRRDLRQRPRGEREPDVGGGAGQVEHAERDGDRREVRAEERDRARGEEEPEAPLAEGTASEPADHAASRRLSQ